MASIAFFGATGGSANAALTEALLNGHKCRALARNPNNLTKMLLEQSINQTVLDEKLTIIKGGIYDQEALKATVFDGKDVVRAIVSGLGPTPQLQWSLYSPVTVNNLTLCGDFATLLVQTLEQLKKNITDYKGPSVAAVSTTGISKGPNDVPFGYNWLYHWLLKVPHVDKRNMESVLRSEPAQIVFSKIVITRATLLLGSHLLSSKGAKLYVGTGESPILGYYVSRADVGDWIYKNVIEESDIPVGVNVFTLTL